MGNKKKQTSWAFVMLVAIAVSLLSVSSFTAAYPAKHAYPPVPSDWTGYNSRLSQYDVSPGYPAYSAHPRYLGELNGTWHDMGKQYGERAGDLIRMTFEGWYREIRPVQGSDAAIIEYVHGQQNYYSTLVPEALEFMQGIADGAKEELDSSVFSTTMTNYEKILMINSYFGLLAKPASAQFSSAASSSGDLVGPACSGAVIFGAATKDGRAIHVSSEDQHFFPQEYLVTFVASPSDKAAHKFTVTDTAGEIGSEHALNSAGVTVSGYAGGGIGVASPTLSAPFSGYRRPGLDWQVGDFYAAAFSNTAKEAVELLTVGRQAYREKSGHKIVIGKCSKGVNWVVSDTKSAYVVESIPADQNGVARYAVRKPGDMGEIGGSYIVSTNNVEAKYSCDENNVCGTSHPMSQHGHYSQDPTPYFALNGTGMRFWTLMWLINNNYGKITPDMVKVWRTAHYVYDADGKRYDSLLVDGKSVSPNLVPGVATLCWHTSGPAGVDTFKGVDTYVSLSTPDNLTVYRTTGRPCEWVGPWDALSLLKVP
jgi:hypothetical protein